MIRSSIQSAGKLRMEQYLDALSTPTLHIGPTVLELIHKLIHQSSKTMALLNFYETLVCAYF